jgi:hypothetical protein
MDAKQLKFLQLFSELSRIPTLEPDSLARGIAPIIKLDFGYGIDVWEYYARAYDDTIAANLALSTYFGNDLLAVFYEQSPPKTIATLTDVDSIAKLVLCHNPLVQSGLVLDIVLSSISGGKLELAEFCLSHLQKNTHIQFDAYIKTVVEHMIRDAIRKAEGNRKVQLPKKQTALLLSFIQRLRGQNKSMLEQRIKEVT